LDLPNEELSDVKPNLQEGFLFPIGSYFSHSEGNVIEEVTGYAQENKLNKNQAQAALIWDNSIKPELERDLIKKMTLLYSGNKDQAIELEKFLKNRADKDKEQLTKELKQIFHGKGQARVFFELAKLITDNELWDRVDILCVPTSLRGSENKRGNEVSLDDLKEVTKTIAGLVGEGHLVAGFDGAPKNKQDKELSDGLPNYMFAMGGLGSPHFNTIKETQIIEQNGVYRQVYDQSKNNKAISQGEYFDRRCIQINEIKDKLELIDSLRETLNNPKSKMQIHVATEQLAIAFKELSEFDQDLLSAYQNGSDRQFNNFPYHLKKMLSELNYFKHLSADTSEVRKLFQDTIRNATSFKKPEEESIAEQIRDKAFESAGFINRYISRESEHFGNRLLELSELVDWPNQLNILVYYEAISDLAYRLIDPTILDLEDLEDNEMADHIRAGLITETIERSLEYIAREQHIPRPDIGPLLMSTSLSVGSETSLYDFYDQSAEEIYTHNVNLALSGNAGEEAKNAYQKFKPIPVEFPKNALPDPIQKAPENLEEVPKNQKIESEGLAYNGIAQYFSNLVEFDKELKSYKNKIDDEKKQQLFDKATDMFALIRELGREELTAVLSGNTKTLESGELVQDLSKVPTPSSIKDLNELLKESKDILENPNHEGIQQSMGKLADLSKKVSGKASPKWKALGIALLVFGCAALVVAGVLAAIPSGGASLFATVAGIATMTSLLGGGVVLTGTGIGAAVYSREKGLAKGITLFRESVADNKPPAPDPKPKNDSDSSLEEEYDDAPLYDDDDSSSEDPTNKKPS
jgi:hypothetical protein